MARLLKIGKVHPEIRAYFGAKGDAWLRDENWLKPVKCSICPTGKMIVLALGDKLGICPLMRYSDQYGLIHWKYVDDEPNASVTSILCLPVRDKNETNLTIIGLSSGMVLFCNEYTTYHMQQFHEGPVLSIKAYSPPDATSYGPDCIVYIVYEKCVFLLNGVDIFCLRPHFLSLSFRKIIFSNNRDAAVLRFQNTSEYDKAIEDSHQNAISSTVYEESKKGSMIIGVGADPYMYFIKEYDEELWTVKSVFRLIFGGRKKRIVQDSSERNRYRFCDGKREGIHIVLSPNGRLAAVSDSLDQVMLMDTQKCVVLNIFKDYREAQCGFICVKEKSLNSSAHLQKRKALFLVIYAPHLGCLEIFALQHGGKIAAFNMSKNGRLIYNSHALQDNNFDCIFFDTKDDSINKIEIPFHLVLSNAQILPDKFRFKKLLHDLKNVTSMDNIAKLAGEIQTNEIKQKSIEILKRKKQIAPEILSIIFNAFANNINSSVKRFNMPLDEQTTQLRYTMENLERLTNFYINMQSSPKTDFEQRLELLDSDLALINQFILPRSEQKGQTETGDHSKSMDNVSNEQNCKNDSDFADYLDIFELKCSDRIPLKRSKSNNFACVSSKLFTHFFQSGLNFEYFKCKAAEAGIPCEDLLELALHYWLEKKFVYDSCDAVISDMSQLAAMVSTISELAGERASDFAYNAISPWWQEVRKRLVKFIKYKTRTFLAAIICRNVALNLWKKEKYGIRDQVTQLEDEKIEQWMPISREEDLWRQNISGCVAFTILKALFTYPNLSMEPVMPEVPLMRINSIQKEIDTKGEGILSELVANWLIFTRIHPKIIVENELDYSEKMETDNVLKKLAILRHQFPFSCQSGMLLSQMSQQYMTHWRKHMNRLKYLRAAIVCLDQFKKSDFALKHGMCCLMWNAALKIPLQSTMKLINEVGPRPIGDLCRQYETIPATLIPEFFELALEFLKQFSMSREYEKKRTLQFEKFLVYGRSPLQDIAMYQFPAIKERLQLFQQVITVLHFIVVFQMDVSKPLTILFNSVVSQMEKGITDEESFEDESDLKTQQQRREFLCNVITASMDLIREDMEELYVAEHLEFMKKIIQLAKSWKLDLVPLKQHQVIQMYAHGYDFEAEKLLKQLNDVEALSAPLIIIAGRRLNLYARTSEKRYLNIASVGHQIMQFLDDLNEIDLKAKKNTIDSTMNAGEEVENTTDLSSSKGNVMSHPKTSSNSLNIAIEARGGDASLMEKFQITATEPKEIEIELLTKLVINAVELLSKSGANASPTLSEYLHVGDQMYDACSVLRNEAHQ